MIGWNFPPNNNGQITGLNDSGIQTFLDNKVSSLARETIQNSIDAHDPKTKRPVEVHFELLNVPSSNFPNKGDFVEILRACKKRWHTFEEAVDFFNEAIEVLDRETISVLKISDYYTTGLTGSNTNIGGDWENLIKSVGASNKDPGAGGSFGIGKHAVFACTPLHTVFYGTHDIEGQKAFQGVAKLVTHENKDGFSTQGTGYFGITEKNDPITSENGLDEFSSELFIRNDSSSGTDIFVFGFNDSDDWKEKIIRSVLENFFVAVWEEKLIVRVADEAINKNSLGKRIEEYFSDDVPSNCKKFYEALVSEDSYFRYLDDFEGMGRIELYLLPKKMFPKRVAMTRKAGMVVYEQGRFQTPMKFAGVFRAVGEDINKFLRSLENPSHSDWVVSRHKDEKYAAKVLGALKTWIRDEIKEVSGESLEDEYDFEGMQQYLPDDLDDNPKQIDENSEELSIPAPVDINIRATKKASQPETHTPSDDAGSDEGEGAEIGNFEGDGTRDGGDAGNAGEGGAGGDGSGSNPNEESQKTGPHRGPVHLKSVRAFCTSPNDGEYKLIFEPTKTASGVVVVTIVGEVEQDIAPVIHAFSNGEKLPINSKGEVGPIPFALGVKQEIKINLANKLHCALEIAAYEN